MTDDTPITTQWRALADECAERADEATEGPWDYRGYTSPPHVCGPASVEVCSRPVDRDGRFIAAARTDVPALARALTETAEAIEILHDVAQSGDHDRVRRMLAQMVGE